MITPDNLDAFLEGLAILGTAGGGAPDWGRRILQHDFELGRRATIVNPEDVPDGAMVASGGIMGSVKILDRIDPNELMQRWDERFELTEAFRVMEQTIGHNIEYIVAFEMGGLNTPVMLSLGARTGIPVINGDGLGRAAPETQMVSFIGHGISLTPMPLVDTLGNIVVVRQGAENTFADQLGRWVITRGGGMGANSHYPMTGVQLKRSVIPHTLTKALTLGEAVLNARRMGIDPVQIVAKELHGRHIQTGLITALEESEWEGFYFTKLSLDRNVKIIIKNEAMALFVEGKPCTIFPDLICLLDPVTGQGMMSANLKVGQSLSVVVTACHPRLREALKSEAGSHAFSPKRFGQPDLVYLPLEELLP